MLNQDLIDAAKASGNKKIYFSYYKFESKDQEGLGDYKTGHFEVDQQQFLAILLKVYGRVQNEDNPGATYSYTNTVSVIQEVGADLYSSLMNFGDSEVYTPEEFYAELKNPGNLEFFHQDLDAESDEFYHTDFLNENTGLDGAIFAVHLGENGSPFSFGDESEAETETEY